MPEIAPQESTVAYRDVSVVLLVLRAVADLMFYDLVIVLVGFSHMRALVKRTLPTNKQPNAQTIERVCTAVDIASCFYFKQVRCMHRSFVAVRLLRKSGVRADLVIGSRPVPFLSHAWVEVDGRVVNDKQGYKRRLLEMERI
jgi:hypothetical protein